MGDDLGSRVKVKGQYQRSKVIAKGQGHTANLYKGYNSKYLVHIIYPAQQLSTPGNLLQSKLSFHDPIKWPWKSLSQGQKMNFDLEMDQGHMFLDFH